MVSTHNTKQRSFLSIIDMQKPSRFDSIRYALVRMLYKLAHPLRIAYWFVFRPHYRGAKVIVRCGDELLFIRNSYGTGYWTFPGGK